MEPLPVERIVAALPRGAGRARARTAGSPPRSAIMTTDTVPKGASRRVDDRRRAGDGHRHREGRRHDPSRTWRRCSRSWPPTRRSPPTARATLAREVADVSFNGATVDGDTSTNDSFVIAATGQAPIAPISARERSAPRARCARRSRTSRSSSRRRSCATARARPSSSRSASKAAATVDECRRVAFAHRALAAREDRVLRLRPQPRPHRVRDRQRGAARSRSGAACRSGSTTCWSSSAAAARASYREEDGQRVMKQDEITVRVDLGRGKRGGDRVDLRLLARLRHRSTPTTAS